MYFSTYLVCIILLGLPGMMSEFIIGRHSASNAARAYTNLGKHKAWGALGLMGIITSMIILGFYAVVAGWCLQYLYASIMGGVHGDAEYVKTYFQTFAADPIRPTLWAVGFILLTHMVVVRGVCQCRDGYCHYRPPAVPKRACLYSGACTCKR